MYRSEKIIIGITLIAVIASIGCCAKAVSKSPVELVPLTAEQQMLVGKLQTLSRGDIVTDPSGALLSQNVQYYLVRGISADEKGSSLFMTPMNDFGFIGMASYWHHDALARANVRVIKQESEEWAQVMRHYFSAEPGSFSK